ncbi:unnamed protein product [Ilex paraguariensis]|uniref:Oberon PHD finger domain-containing protein n=1 Tax=Ilex paraguariensis TaxID=185542 RepID=A0ABC8T2I1_9AQUA
MRKPEGKSSSLCGFVLDPAKFSQLGMGEKRQLVHEIAKWPEDAPKVLSSLSRRELLDIICAEMGKERKYSGFTKFRMIEHLLKLVCNRSKKKNIDKPLVFSPTKTEACFERQSWQEHLLRQPIQIDHTSWQTVKEAANILLCQNLACRATLSPGDVFCKRCSCCICHQYDDNKDPSLWLICDSDHPKEGDSCGMSCHLKCALEHKRAGVLKNDRCTKLDGGFYCVFCGKINGLMRTWKKQLVVAKEARRVDALCLRVSLSHKILEGTEQYKELLKIVESAVKKLENEVGPLDGPSPKKDSGIVKRLYCGTEVQQLCSSAVEAFDSISYKFFDHLNQKEPPITMTACRIRFEELSPTTVIILLEYEDCLLKEILGCRLWHQKSTIKDYPEEATYIVLRPETRFKLTGLDPSTEYFCKVLFFSKNSTLGALEAKWVTPALRRSTVSKSDEEQEKKENALIANSYPQMYSEYSNLTFSHSMKDVLLVSPTSNPPPTPCKYDGKKELSFMSSKKQLKGTDYENSVGVIRWLEHEGHLNADFRVKFLTWFSLKATLQERRVVSAFIDTLIDDPPSLAGQLIDTFSDEISCEQKPVPRLGLCTTLWH